MLEVIDPGVYCCTVTGANGCTSSACETVMVNGTVFDPVISFMGDPCSLGERTLVATVTGGVAPYSYAWSTGSTDVTATLPAGFSGLVNVVITDNNNCSAQGSISIAPDISIFAITTKESSPGAADGSIDLLVTGGLGPFTFLWNNGSMSAELTGLSAGIYTVTVTGANDCTSVLTIPLITVGVEEVNAGPSVRIIPNPAQDWMMVHVDNPGGQLMRLSIKDASGRLIATQHGDLETFFFDTSILSGGLYVLWVETNLGKKAFKVTVGR